MIAPFDIFRVDPKDGALLWCETAQSLEAAKQRVWILWQARKTQFVIVSLKTGNRITVDPAQTEPPSTS